MIREAAGADDAARRGRWLAALLAVCLTGSATLVWSASRAAFTATTATGGVLTTGVVVLGDNDAGTVLFTAGAVAPGDTQTRCVEVSYTGDVAAAVRMTASGSGALADWLGMTVELGTGASAGSGGCTGFVPSGTMFTGTLTQLLTRSAFASGLTGFDPAGPATASYRITWTLDPAVPDSGQGSAATASFTWQARSGVPVAPFTVYGFDEAAGTVVADSSLNRNPARYEGGVVLGRPPAPGSGAGPASFDCGTGTDRVRGDGGYAFRGRDPFTIGLWVWPSVLDNTYYSLVGRGTMTGGWWDRRGFSLGIHDWQGFYLERNDGDPGNDYVKTGGAGLTAGTWYHVAVTYDGAVLTMYLNGAAVATDPDAATVVPDVVSTYPLRVCGLDGYTAFPGRVDDLRIFNRALGGAEVAALAS